MSGLASVIIPTYNRPGLLRRALASVATQDYRPLEAVVVNDGGMPVGEVLAEFAGTLDIHAVEHGEQRWLPAARNSGIAASHGEYLAYLDDDDALLPHHLSALIATLEQQGADCAYSDFALVYEDRENGREVDRQERDTGRFPPERIAVECFVPVCSVVHRRQVLDRTGRFDEALTKGMEDWDLWLRVFPAVATAHAKGATCLVYQDLAPTNMSTRDFASFAVITEMLYDRYAGLVAGRPDLQRERRKILEIRRRLGGLLAALSEAAGGNSQVTLSAPDLLRARGFGRQVHDLVAELAERTVESESWRGAMVPMGKRRLLAALVRECLHHPLPAWLRRRTEGTR